MEAEDPFSLGDSSSQDTQNEFHLLQSLGNNQTSQGFIITNLNTEDGAFELELSSSSEHQNKKIKLHHHEEPKTTMLFGVDICAEIQFEIPASPETKTILDEDNRQEQTTLHNNFIVDPSSELVSSSPLQSNSHQTFGDPWIVAWKTLQQKYFDIEQDELHEFGQNSWQTYEAFQCMWPSPSSCVEVTFPWILPDEIPKEPTKDPYHCRAQLCTAIGNELYDLSEWLQLTPKEVKYRNDTISKITVIARSLWTECEVKLFGSSATNLALPSSDIDIAILHCTFKTKRYWDTANPEDKLAGHFSQNSYDWIKDFSVISSARVPIIKLRTILGINVDICFEVPGGIKNTEIINRAHEYISSSDKTLRKEQLRCVVLPIKMLLDQFDLHMVWTGGLGSYCLYLMVIAHMKEFFLKYPHLKDIDENWIAGELFMTFLRKYGFEFNYHTHSISIQHGSVLKMIPTGTDILSVLDELSSPGHDGVQDIGGGCYRFIDVKRVFRIAHYFLSIPAINDQGNSVETTLSCKPFPSFISRVLQVHKIQRS